MGSWNKTCGISNLHIKNGDEVLVFVLQQATGNDRCYSTAFFSPIVLPFYSTYADYGRGQNSHGVGYPYIMHSLKTELIEMPLGDNVYHDIEVSREKWDEDLFFDAVHEHRLKVYGWNKQELDIEFVMFRKDIVDFILENWVQEDYVGGENNPYIYYKFKDILADVPEYLDKLQLELSNITTDLPASLSVKFFRGLSGLFDYSHPNKVSKFISDDNYRYCRIFRPSQILIDMMSEGKREEAELFIVDYLKGVYLNLFLELTRKHWMPGGHEGSQNQEHEPYKILINAMQHALDQEAASYDDYDDELGEYNNDLIETGQKPITWQNVLNYKHLPALGWSLSTFSEQATTLGFPYFCWNDRIYETETGNDTGFVAVDIR